MEQFCFKINGWAEIKVTQRYKQNREKEMTKSLKEKSKKKKKENFGNNVRNKERVKIRNFH